MSEHQGESGQTVMQCPECGGDVSVPNVELEIGRRVGCLHCGFASRLAPEPQPDGEGRLWRLMPLVDTPDRG